MLINRGGSWLPLLPFLCHVMAGYLIVRFSGAGAGNRRLLPLVLLAGACLYAGGALWTRAFRRESPSSASESTPRQAGRGVAFLLAVLASTASLLLAMTAGMETFFLCGFLLGAAMLLGIGAGRLTGTAALLEGILSGGAVLLGMCVFPIVLEWTVQPLFLAPPALLLIYGAAGAAPEPIMEDGRAETEEEESIPGGATTVVVVLAGAILLLSPAAAFWLLPHRWVATALLAAAALIPLPALIEAMRAASAKTLRRMANASRVGTCFFAAGLVTTFAGLAPSRVETAGIVLVAAFAFPTLVAWRHDA